MCRGKWLSADLELGQQKFGPKLGLPANSGKGADKFAQPLTEIDQSCAVWTMGCIGFQIYLWSNRSEYLELFKNRKLSPADVYSLFNPDLSSFNANIL